MALAISDNANRASAQSLIEPILVLELDGVSTIYGTRKVQKRIKVGEPGLKVGGGWKIGGLSEVIDQVDLISLTGGTTSSIKQQLQPDKGQGSSISTLSVALVDRGGEITRLVSPSIVIPEIIGRKAKVYLGFNDIAFPDDYSVIFRGIVSDVQVGPGLVLLTMSAPDVKKKQTLFTQAKMKLTTALNATELSSIAIDDATDILPISVTRQVATGYTTAYLQKYVLISDELIEYDHVASKTSLTPIIARGALATTPAAHAVGVDVSSFYRIKSDVMDIALRLMLSDEDLTPMFMMTPTSFGYTTAQESKPNAMWFAGVDLFTDYNLRVGDYWIDLGQVKGSATVFSVRRATVPNPNYQITGVEVRKTGTLVYTKSSFTTSTTPSSNTVPYPIEFINRYNTLGYGCGMDVDEVDIDQHEKLQRQYLSGFVFDCYFKDDTYMKDYIEQSLYAACGCYSIPRQGKASVGYHINAVPGVTIKTLSIDNVRNPSTIRVRRSINNNFLNTIVTKFDLGIKTDDFNSGNITISQDSLTRIPVGTKAQVNEAPGLRAALNGNNLASQTAKRLLKRYQYAAEYIEAIKVLFSVGYTIEIGDILFLDGASLGLINSYKGDRTPSIRLYEVANKSMDLRSGDITLSLVDTNYAIGNRYALVVPSSKVTAVTSATQFTVGAINSPGIYGTSEGLKWSRFLVNNTTVGVKVRSPDSTTRYGQTTIVSVTGNVITVDSLSFTPQVGDIFEFANYDFAQTTATTRSTYGFMTDGDFFDATPPYQMV